jgi:hypothetical protein
MSANWTLGKSLKAKGLVNDVDDDGDDDDEPAAAASTRRSRAEGEEDGDVGVKINEDGDVVEPFHLQNEREEGHFDQAGNYVFHRKKKGEEDAWLEGMDEAELEKSIGEAAEAKRKRQERSAAEETRLQSLHSANTPAQLKRELLGFLQLGDTVARAMRRLGGGGAGKRPNAAQRAQLDRLTEISSLLLAHGATSIFETTHAALKASLDSRPWQYRGLDGVVHGPFSSKQMAAWRAQDFFQGESAVMLQRVAAPSSSSPGAWAGAGAGAGSGRGSKRGRGSVAEAAEVPAAKKPKAASDELLADLEDEEDEEEDEEEEEKEDEEEEANEGGEEEPWVSSDDVDFGALEGLEDEGDAGAGGAGVGLNDGLLPQALGEEEEDEEEEEEEGNKDDDDEEDEEDEIS